MPPTLLPPETLASLPQFSMTFVVPTARPAMPPASPLPLLVLATVPCTTTFRISASLMTPNRPAYCAETFSPETVWPCPSKLPESSCELTPMGAKGKPPRSMSSVRTAQIFAPAAAETVSASHASCSPLSIW